MVLESRAGVEGDLGLRAERVSVIDASKSEDLGDSIGWDMALLRVSHYCNSHSVHSPGRMDSVRYVVVADGDNRDDMVEVVAKMRGLLPLDLVPVPLSVGGGEE